VPDVLSKMHLMRVIPDERTYNYMIRAAAETGDTAAAERFLEEAGASTAAASLEFGVGKHFYTSLMQAYVKKNEPEMSYKILQEMIEKGI
jgi:pentatricopeptide repeat protein